MKRLVLARLAWTVTVGAAYVWPLDQPAAPTSTFGEYRRRHFHGGVDLSTQETVGLPVRALAAGEVERVRTSGAGYGRALYLRLEDGRTAVYGHLDGFAPDLERWVADVQESTGSYEQDLKPPAGGFRYGRGAVVGYAGESGAGPAHLHLELRQGDTGLNPLRQGLTVPDAVPPVLSALWVYAAGAEGRAEGSAFPMLAAARRVGEGVYRVERPLAVLGPVRVGLEAFDRTEAKPNRLGIYGLTAWLDGEEVYAASFDSVSWLETVEVDVVFDARVRGAGGEAYALTPPAGLACRALVRSSPAWFRADGAHALVVEARDANGNRSRLEATLTWGQGAGSTAGARDGRRRRASAGVETDWGPRRLTLRSGRVAELSTRPELAPARAAGDSVPAATPEGAGRTERSFAVPDDFVGILELVRGGGRVERRLSVTMVEPGWRRALYSADSVLEMQFGPGAVFERVPVAAEVRSSGEGGAQAPPGPAAARGPGARVGARYRVEPAWIALAEPVLVSVRLDSATAGERVGLFVQAADGQRFVGGPDSLERTLLQGRTRDLGEFVVVRDTEPPVLGAARLRRGARTGAGGARPAPLEVRWRTADGVSGVDAEACELEVDGRRRPVEYDGENGVLRWRPIPAPPAGVHRYRIVARDRLGNRSAREGTIRIP